MGAARCACEPGRLTALAREQDRAVLSRGAALPGRRVVTDSGIAPTSSSTRSKQHGQTSHGRPLPPRPCRCREFRLCRSSRMYVLVQAAEAIDTKGTQTVFA